MGMSFKVVTINHSYLPSRANTSVHLQLWNPKQLTKVPCYNFGLDTNVLPKKY